MPDILIRGMEMPTEGGAIGIYKISGNFYAARVGKDELFPLVELPPHGDLIDRSDVFAVVDESYEYGDIIKRKDFDENNIPAIVPAERRDADD